MRPAKKVALASLCAAIIASLASGHVVHACDCAAGLHYPWTMDRYGVDSVIQGLARSVDLSDPRTTRVMMDVSKVWQGPATPAYEIRLPINGSMCQVHPVEGITYVVAGSSTKQNIGGVGVVSHSGYCFMRSVTEVFSGESLGANYAPPIGIGEICPQTRGKVPDSVVQESVRGRNGLRGWGETQTPGLASRFNPWRKWISLRTADAPYHPIYNSLVWKASCP